MFLSRNLVLALPQGRRRLESTLHEWKITSLGLPAASILVYFRPIDTTEYLPIRTRREKKILGT